MIAQSLYSFSPIGLFNPLFFFHESYIYIGFTNFSSLHKSNISFKLLFLHSPFPSKNKQQETQCNQGRARVGGLGPQWPKKKKKLAGKFSVIYIYIYTHTWAPLIHFILFLKKTWSLEEEVGKDYKKKSIFLE